MEVESVVAKHIVNTRYEDLPAQAIEATKAHLLDTIAAAIGGSSAPGCKLLLDQVREWGGKEESSVLVFGGKLPAPSAAYVNGTIGHARDFDDNHDTIAYKGSVAAVPAAFAAAEQLGLSGKEFLTAVCLGVDLGCRLGLAIQPKPSHAFARALGCYAAAAAAGKALGLNQEQMLDALGLAHCEVGVAGMSTEAPSLTKRLGLGIATRAGVTAAFLARRGYPAGRELFHGPRGYYCLYERQEGDLTEITEGLGQRYEIVRLGMKPYPSCRYTHANVDASMAIMRENGVEAHDIERVTVSVTPRDYAMVGGNGDQNMVEWLRHPRGVVDAQFSVLYTTAVAITKGKVVLDHVSEPGLKDPEVLQMADRITAVPDAGLVAKDRDVQPQAVEIVTKDGRSFSKRVDYPKGSPQNPMTPEERVAKYWDCIGHAAVPISEQRAREALASIQNLEKLDNISRLLGLLSP